MRSLLRVLFAAVTLVLVPASVWAQGGHHRRRQGRVGRRAARRHRRSGQPRAHRKSSLGRQRRHRPVSNRRSADRHVFRHVLADRLQHGEARRHRVDRHVRRDGQRRSESRRARRRRSRSPARRRSSTSRARRCRRRSTRTSSRRFRRRGTPPASWRSFRGWPPTAIPAASPVEPAGARRACTAAGRPTREPCLTASTWGGPARTRTRPW